MRRSAVVGRPGSDRSSKNRGECLPGRRTLVIIAGADRDAQVGRTGRGVGRESLDDVVDGSCEREVCTTHDLLAVEGSPVTREVVVHLALGSAVGPDTVGVVRNTHAHERHDPRPRPAGSFGCFINARRNVACDGLRPP